MPGIARTIHSSRTWLAGLLSAGLLLLGHSSHCAASEEMDFRAERAFFAGKRLTYLVATSPGGGYDTYARLIARHLPRYLGVRNVVVKNVPGASHLIGLHKLAHAEPDGLTIGTFNTGLLMGPNPLNIDLGTLSWIGKASSEPRVFVVANARDPIGMDDLRAAGSAPVLYATSGLLSASHLQMKRIGQAFGLNIRPIHGFSGSETQLVVMRGDVSGGLMSLSRVEPAVRAGKLAPVFFVGQSEPPFPVPALVELAATPEQEAVSEQIETLSALGRLSAAPPGMASDRLAFLRRAYVETLADERLLLEAKRLNLLIDPWHGATVAERIRRLHDATGSARFD